VSGLHGDRVLEKVFVALVPHHPKSVVTAVPKTEHVPAPANGAYIAPAAMRVFAHQGMVKPTTRPVATVVLKTEIGRVPTPAPGVFGVAGILVPTKGLACLVQLLLNPRSVAVVDLRNAHEPVQELVHGASSETGAHVKVKANACPAHQ
jgi:hypothetical protein